jgi:hypothetical protein
LCQKKLFAERGKKTTISIILKKPSSSHSSHSWLKSRALSVFATWSAFNQECEEWRVAVKQLTFRKKANG